MDEDVFDSDQEYETIDEKGKSTWTHGHHKRLPLPLPGELGKPKGGRASNPYSLKEEESAVPPPLASKLRSVGGSVDSAQGPPLPPPNPSKKVTRSPTKSTSRPPLPPPLKPRSMTIGDLPPSIPPKPGPKTISISFDSAPPRRRRIEDDFIIENDELNLESFVSKYREEFPLQVRVSKGFYGNSERTSVSEGDTFNIHFIKNTKVVNMEDGVGGKFKIGLNSGIEFGLLYDPNEKRDEALTGFTFNKVFDMLQMKSLPKVVRVGASWLGSSSDSTLEMNELLVVKSWKRKVGGKILKVYNPQTKKKKELPENCIGKFSTRPYDVRLYLSDIMEHVITPLPSNAIFFVHSDCISELPAYLATSVVKLKALDTETTLVATGVFEAEYEENQAVEIPFDLDIEVQVMRPKQEQDTEDLYQSTRKLLENFQKIKTSAYVSSSTETGSEAQAALYSIVREGKELVGIDIVKPSTIYANLPGPPVAKKNTKGSVSSSQSLVLPPRSESTYSDIESIERLGTIEESIIQVENGLQQVEQKVSSLSNVDELTSKVSREITSARADMKRLEARVVKASEDAAKAKADVADLIPVVQQLKKICESLQQNGGMQPPQGNLESSSVLRQQGYMTLSPQGSADMAYSTADESVREANRTFLATLDFVQVLTVLENMGLVKHREAFMEERVNGEILLECDDTILQEELRVKSKLHRVRLMKLIEGKYSAEKILQGEDPYVYAQPK